MSLSFKKHHDDAWSEIKKRKRQIWRRARECRVLIVEGIFDKAELALEKSDLKVTLVEGEQVPDYNLEDYRLMIVNCPGNDLPTKQVRRFVAQGGYLLTTDWCLNNLLEEAFPGYLRWSGNSTRDEAVKVNIADFRHPFIKELDPNIKLNWWLDGASHPIVVLNSAVTVLVESDELGKRYGYPAVLVTFDYQRGKVAHMISHVYLEEKVGSKDVYAAQYIISNIVEEIAKRRIAITRPPLAQRRGGFILVNIKFPAKCTYCHNQIKTSRAYRCSTCGGIFDERCVDRILRMGQCPFCKSPVE